MAAEESTGTEIPTQPAERVRAIVENVLDALGLDGDVELEESGERIEARVEGDDLGLLIGRRGQTIDAVQLLCYRAAFRGEEERKRVTVDAAGYRGRREDLLHREADTAAERALRKGGPVDLEPMSATERRVVHERLKDRPEVETYSEGEEPDRRVVIAPLMED